MEITIEEYNNAVANKEKLKKELFEIKVEIAHLPRNIDRTSYLEREEKIRKELAKVLYKIVSYEREERGKKL